MREITYRIPKAPHLALLSDLHNRPYQQIIESLQKHSPDLICITGDLVYGTQPENDESPLITQKNILPFLIACNNIAPTYLSLGNHEWMLDEEDLEMVRSTGVVMLDNEWVERDGIIIGGLTSAAVTEYRKFRNATGSDGTRYPRKESRDEAGGLKSRSERFPEVSWLEEFASVPGFKILMSHHPEYAPLISRDVDLILSGHCHGGQLRLFGRGLYAPGQGWFPKYSKGVYEGRLVVSAGLSNTAHIPRLFNPTEIVFISPDCRLP